MTDSPVTATEIMVMIAEAMARTARYMELKISPARFERFLDAARIIDDLAQEMELEKGEDDS